MIYRNLASVVLDLETTGQLVRINAPVDARLEIGLIQRRAFAKKGPALLFTNVKGCSFPMLANLFGVKERIRYLFQSSLASLEALFALKADPFHALRHPLRYARLPLALLHALPKKVASGPVAARRTTLSSLPQLVCWPQDGGSYVTLPQVYTENPARPGFFHSNMGMYRVQLSGKGYAKNTEAGLHYQIHRGIGPHHAEALARGEDLPVVVSIGGPPALALSALFPLPEDLPEICFAGLLAGHRIPMLTGVGPLPIPAESDFAIIGRLRGARTAPEGPFGDHMGYYSLEHDFPVLTVDAVRHREGAIWPFTTVGRPPQEDTLFGEFVHELTQSLVPAIFPGVKELYAVDDAGVHPLLLAVGRERYVPFAGERCPQELISCGLHLLGTSQTSLSKYVLAAAAEDDATLSAHDIPAFFTHMLARTDFRRDLHFITRTTMDTLDYTGITLNQGSKLLWTAAGREKRRLATEKPANLILPEGFGDILFFAPGVLLCKGPVQVLPRDTADSAMEKLAEHLTGQQEKLAGIALVVVADDAAFTGKNWSNFLWVTFTRSDPATDIYGVSADTICKHWSCEAPLIMDARLKSYQAKPLEMDGAVEKRVEAMAAKGGPLYGLI
ncbi:3-octaprenyl-4-hydroxybenzoate carboxy-lyase [Deltaproteobacteria bacterium]|nr:3-octaprenyl-4-hydroxybenzoate carboxy-lyase [Deltaproteobacteria bacterium]